MNLVMINQLPELYIPRIQTQQKSMTVTQEKRNPYLSKWEALFDNTNEQWISFQPKIGKIAYPCFACRDMFANRNSFLDHINRRGMVLKYFCFHCSKDMNFYNGCSFLLHARTHFSEKVGYIDLEKVDISIIPMDEAGFLPDPKFPRLFDVDDSPPNYNLTVNVKYYKPKDETKGRRIVYFESNDLVFYCTDGPLILVQINENIPKCEFFVMKQAKNNPPVINSENETADDTIPEKNDTLYNNEVESEESNNNDEEDDILSMHSIHDEVISLSEDENDTTIDKIQIRNIQTMIKSSVSNSSDEDSLLQPMSQILKPLEVSTNMPLCVECGKMQTTTMKNHFQQNDRPDKDEIKCFKCSLILPSMCALQSHIRIHDQKAPFVCPECGKEFRVWFDLSLHMEDVCFHLAKHVKYKCPARKCGKIFAQTVTFSTHFPIHVTVKHTCDICGLTLLSLQLFQQHAQEHVFTEALSVKSYECTLCGDQFDTVEEHVKYHCTNRENRIYVYTCKYCKSYYRSKNTYAAHLLRCPKFLFNSQVKKEEKVVNKNIQCQVERFCYKCKSKIQFHCMYKDIKNVGKTCPQCNTDFFKNDTIENAKGPRLLTCVLCNLQFTKYSKHKCKYQNPTVSLNRLNNTSELYNYDTSSLTSSPTTSEESRPKQKRKKSQSPLKNKKIKEEIEEFIITPIIFEGEYKCNVCDFKTESRKTFQIHIKLHRDVSTAYQCMDCGECFVVKPSLAKHLQVFHLIENIEQYFNDNDCYDKDAVKELEENMRKIPGEVAGPLEKNQCRVCKEIFSDDLELKKHFRIHGMAFLMRNSVSK